MRASSSLSTSSAGSCAGDLVTQSHERKRYQQRHGPSICHARALCPLGVHILRGDCIHTIKATPVSLAATGNSGRLGLILDYHVAELDPSVTNGGTIFSVLFIICSSAFTICFPVSRPHHAFSIAAEDGQQSICTQTIRYTTILTSSPCATVTQSPGYAAATSQSRKTSAMKLFDEILPASAS